MERDRTSSEEEDAGSDASWEDASEEEEDFDTSVNFLITSIWFFASDTFVMTLPLVDHVLHPILVMP